MKKGSQQVTRNSEMKTDVKTQKCNSRGWRTKWGRPPRVPNELDKETETVTGQGEKAEVAVTNATLRETCGEGPRGVTMT